MGGEMNTRLNRGSLRSMPGGVDSDLDSGFGSSTFGRGIMHGFMGAEGPRNDGNVGEGSRGRDHRDLVGASSADMFFELQKSDDGVLRGTNVFNVDAYVDSGNTNSKDDVRNSPSDFSTSDVRPYGEDDIYSDRVESAHSDGRGEIGEHSGGSVRAGSNDGDGGGVGRVISNANSKVGRENLSATRGPNRPKGAGTRAGRIRVKWGLDVDVEVPLLLESLVKGPWDPRGEVWALQVDMACEVIRRSGGVVFIEQLAPILNPPHGPKRWATVRERSASARDGRASFGSFEEETFVVRLLTELDGTPEVTDDGDIMYVFRGLASTSERNAYGTTPDSGVAQQWKATVPEGGEAGSARPEVMLFEELPGTMESLAKIPTEGTKGDLASRLTTDNVTTVVVACPYTQAVMRFAQRAALAGFALFLTTILVIGQLIFGSWPTWVAIGPIYLAWIAVDDTLRRWRYDSAIDRDRWRKAWADYVSLDDSDTLWRKRAAARRRAKLLLEEGD